MTKRRPFLLLGFLALVGIVLGLLAMLPPTPGLTKSNVERIKVGMTGEECSAIIGENYSQSVYPIAGGSGCRLTNEDESGAIIELDSDFKVRKIEWVDGPQEGMIAKLRRWLHLD